MMCDDDALGVLFRYNETETPVEASEIVVTALPTAYLLCVWLLLEASRERRAFSRAWRRAGALLGLGAGAGLVLCAWRVLCEDVWRAAAAAGAGVFSAVGILALGPRAPRVGIAAFALLAAAAVVANAFLRGARVPLVAAQQLWCLQAAALFPLLPGRRFGASSSVAPQKRRGGAPPPVVDALAKRAPEDLAARPCVDARSWFV